MGHPVHYCPMMSFMLQFFYVCLSYSICQIAKFAQLARARIMHSSLEIKHFRNARAHIRWISNRAWTVIWLSLFLCPFSLSFSLYLSLSIYFSCLSLALSLSRTHSFPSRCDWQIAFLSPLSILIIPQYIIYIPAICKYNRNIKE